MDGEKELQEEKTFSIFIQTDYILNETSNIARTEKRQIGLQPNTSPAPMYVFANVHLLEFLDRHPAWRSLDPTLDIWSNFSHLTFCQKLVI